MKVAPHYKLIKEHPGSFELHDARDGRSFHVAKQGLDEPAQKTMAKIPAYAEGGDVLEEDAPTTPATGPSDMPTAQPVPEVQAPAAATPAPMAATPAAPQVPTQPGMGAPGDYGAEEIGALKTGARAEAKSSEQTGAAWEKYNKDVAALPTASDKFANHQAQDDALQKKFADTTLDPNRYWNSLGTAGKISASLAVAFGNFGAALTGGPNYAQQSIENAMNRDMESQKADQSKSMNLWKMNRENAHSDLEADAMTKNQMYAAVLAKGQQYAAQAGGPMAAAKIAPMIAGIKQNMAVNNMFRSMSGAGQQGDEASYAQKLDLMDRVNPAYGKELRARFLPGIGTSTVPMDPKDRESLESLTNIDHLMKKAINFQANTAGLGGTWTAENRSKANSLTEQISTELNKVDQLNRVNGFEGESYHKRLGTIGDVNAGGTLQNLRSIQDQINDHKATFMKQHGVVPFQQSAQAMAGNMVRVQHPNGSIGSIPSANLAAAVNQGYKQVQ